MCVSTRVFLACRAGFLLTLVVLVMFSIEYHRIELILIYMKYKTARHCKLMNCADVARANAICKTSEKRLFLARTAERNAIQPYYIISQCHTYTRTHA